MSLPYTILQITASAADTASKTPAGFKTMLIASEIVITLIVFVGFYLIFSRYKKKEKEYLKNNQR